MEKGEIARNEQFLLFFDSVFKRLALQTRKIRGLFGKGLSSLITNIYLIPLSADDFVVVVASSAATALWQ